MTKTRVGITIFVLVTALGPLFTAPGYSPMAHVISELAAQNTPRNWLMAAAFVLLGASVVIDGAMALRPPLLPFMAFGVFFGAAGLFGHKPIAPEAAYIPWVDTMHSALATLSGIALTVGFVWQALRARTVGHRALAGALAVVCVGMPLLMLERPAQQGVIQRVMYLMVFAWLWAFYPRRMPA